MVQERQFRLGSPLGDSFGYESWHGIWELPCLNHGNPEVRNYLLDTVRFWVQEFDIDGIRLDCAGDLSFEFMQELRRLANEIKPEFWLMGEVIHGEYARWVNPQMLHSVTNYEMHKVSIPRTTTTIISNWHTMSAASKQWGGISTPLWTTTTKTGSQANC